MNGYRVLLVDDEEDFVMNLGKRLQRRGMKVETLEVRNSGDTAGDRRNVVGYGAWVFLEQ